MSPAARPAQSDAARIWQMLVALVMESRGDWRRQASEVTGLPFSRVRALRRLKDQDRSLRELAWEMGTDAPAATVIINDLEERGLVERRAHPEDRRSKLVSLTAEGRKRVAALRKISDAPPSGFGKLSGPELAQLRKLLERVGGAG